jgi:hypothetical protein
MAVKHETTDLREPGEKETVNVQADPMVAANPMDREYTKYKATITTDIPGAVPPDIPEPVQETINVDFTDKQEPILGGLNDKAPGAGDGVGDGSSVTHDIEHDTDDDAGDSRVDFTQSEKLLMAKVITSMGMEGLKVVNDAIINKWLITENHVAKRILDGEADPNILDYKINLGASVIDLSLILTSNKNEVEKAFRFTKDEEKRITELLALILKDNNVQMKPEWMLLAMMAQKYGLGIYTLNKINSDTQDLLNRVNQILIDNKRSHNIPSGPGVTIEPNAQDKQPTAAGPKKAAKAAKVGKKEAPPKPAEETTVNADEKSDDAETVVAEMREPGEIPAKPRRAKRMVDKASLNQLAQDVSYTKVKD